MQKRTRHLLLNLISAGAAIGTATTAAPNAASGQVYSEHRDGAQQLTLRADAYSLSDALAWLAARTNWNFVVDDQPVLRDTAFNLRGAPREILETVARRFDYRVTEVHAGLFTLRKAFVSPDEHPQMNLGEMRKMASDAVRVLTALPTPAQPFVTSPWLQNLYSSFTPEQRQFLERPGNCLSVRDLMPDQQKMLLAALVDARFGAFATSLPVLARKLSAFPRAALERHAATTRPPADAGVQDERLTQTYYRWDDASGVYRDLLVSPDGVILPPTRSR